MVKEEDSETQKRKARDGFFGPPPNKSCIGSICVTDSVIKVELDPEADCEPEVLEEIFTGLLHEKEVVFTKAPRKDLKVRGKDVEEDRPPTEQDKEE